MSFLSAYVPASRARFAVSSSTLCSHVFLAALIACCCTGNVSVLAKRSAPSPTTEYETTCHQRGWWTLFLAPVEHIEDLLPEGFRLAKNVSILTWPGDVYPILLETQVQSNCSNKLVPSFHSTFHEFKLEIPYVLRKNSTNDKELFMYKPLIYANSLLDWFGDYFFYHLNMRYAKNMPTNNSFFAVDYLEGEFRVDFQATSQWLPAQTYWTANQLDVLANMTTLPWLCERHLSKCAYNSYDWSNASARQANAHISVGNGVLPDIGPDSTIDVMHMGDNPYGAFELDATLYITSAEDCPY